MIIDRDPIVAHLAELLARVAYIEHLDETHGPNNGRAREHAALQWAIELAEEQFPDASAPARGLAGRVNEWRSRNWKPRA